MWSMPVVLTDTENENDSVNQNDVAKMTSQCRMETAVVLCTNPLILRVTDYPWLTQNFLQKHLLTLHQAVQLFYLWPVFTISNVANFMEDDCLLF